MNRHETERVTKKYSSATHYILAGLIPYTEANIKLSFKPSAFFSDLEKLDKVNTSRKVLQNAYYRAIKRGQIIFDDQGIPRLTPLGIRKIKLFKPKKLKSSKLMIIFDIPEAEKYKRNHLRTLLKELSFKQVQKSVWMSEYDTREYLHMEIKQYGLQPFVQIFEARSIQYSSLFYRSLK